MYSLEYKIWEMYSLEYKNRVFLYSKEYIKQTTPFFAIYETPWLPIRVFQSELRQRTFWQ